MNLSSSDDSFEKAELTIHSSKMTVTSSTGIPNYMNSYSIYGTTEKYISGDVVVNKNAWDDTGVNYNYQTSISLPPNSHLLEEDDLVTITWEFISDTDIEKLCFKCVDYSSSYEEYWTYISDGFFVSDKIIANEPYTVNASIPITKKATGQITIEISYPKENNGEATLSTIDSKLKISRRDVSNNDESSQSKFTYTPTKDGIKFGGSLLSNIQDQTAKCTISIRDVDNGITMNREYSLANSNAYESWEMVYPLVEKDKEYTFEVSTKCGSTTIGFEKVTVTAVGGLGEYKIENTDTYTVTLSADKKTLTRTPQEFTDNLNVQNLVIDYGTKYAIYSTNYSATTIWDGIWRHDSIHWASTTKQECDLTNLETWLSYEGLVSSLKGRRLGTRTETHMTLAGYTYNGTTDFVLNDYKETFFDWDDKEQYNFFVLYKDPKTGEYYEDVPGTSLYYIKEELDENGNISFTEKDAEGSIEVHGQLISYGDKLYEPAYVPATEIEDHVFTGYWKANCGYQSIEQINFPYNSNDFWGSGEVVPVYLTPVYKMTQVHLYFMNEDGTVFETKTYNTNHFTVSSNGESINFNNAYTPDTNPTKEDYYFDYWECETGTTYGENARIYSIDKVSNEIFLTPIFSKLSDDDTTSDEVTEVVIFEVKSSYQDEAHCKEIGNKTALSEFAGKTVVLTIKYLEGDRTGWEIGEVFFATDNADLYGTKTDDTIPLEGVAATDNICTIECPVDEVIAAMGDAEYISINLYNQTELVKISVK